MILRGITPYMVIILKMDSHQQQYTTMSLHSTRTAAIISSDYDKMRGEVLCLCESAKGDKLSFSSGFLTVKPAEGKSFNITIPYKNKENSDTLSIQE